MQKIKFLATNYKQMSVPDFCVSISKFIQAESFEKDERSSNFRPYLRHPEIKCSTYKAVAFAITNKRYIVYESVSSNDGFKIYAIASREGIDEDGGIFEAAVQKFKNLSWDSFDDFTYCTKRIKILCGEEGHWKCTCYRYSREHHCVHSLLLSYLRNDTTVVLKVLENTRLARTKKSRGNTQKAKPALVKQPNVPVLADGRGDTRMEVAAKIVKEPQSRGLTVNRLSAAALSAAPTQEV